MSVSSDGPLDLVPPAGDPWADLDVPEGWDRVADVCRHVGHELDDLVDSVVEALVAEVPDYLGGDRVELADLRASIRRNFEMTLVGVAERRGPDEQELQIRRELGRRRAMQGHPIDDLIRAYHIGYRELWRTLVDTAEEMDQETAARLLRASGTAWTWVHEVTSVVAEAHREVERARAEVTASLRQRFLDLLLTPNADERELADVALSLGFETDGVFQVATARPASPGASRRVEEALGQVGVVGRWIPRGDGCVVVAQTDGEDGLLEKVVAGHVGDGAIGLGLARPGLAGARASVGDADRALELARKRGGLVRFADDWLATILTQMDDRLEPLLAAGTEVARQQPMLADTVEAFARSSFSVAGTARALGLHPNSVSYRLSRWKELTGWDAQTYDGLSRSLAAIDLAR